MPEVKYGYLSVTLTFEDTGADLEVDLTAFENITSFSDLTIESFSYSWGSGTVITFTTEDGSARTVTLNGVSIYDVDENDFIFHVPEGEADNDTLTGGAGADTFVFEPGHGNDIIVDFTDGEDTIDLSGFVNITSFDDLTVADVDDGDGGTNARITLTDADGNTTTVTLVGVSGSNLDAGDFIFYDPIVTGTDEADTLSGGVGDDTLTGGAGADTFVFAPGHGNDTIADFVANEDKIDLTAFTGVERFSDLTITEEGDDLKIDLRAHGGGTIVLQGITLAEVDAADFVIYDPTVTGTAGDDTLVGRERADNFVFEPDHGNDTIQNFSSGLDTIDLTAFLGIERFADLTITQEGDDIKIDLTAHGGGTIVIEDMDLMYLDPADFVFYDPRVTGTDADETLSGGAGVDYIWGHGGADTIYGGDAGDFIYAGDGADTIYGGEGNDSIYGGDGADTIYGGDGADTIYGGEGNDWIFGGAGEDTIYGGAGDDTIYGGGPGDKTIYGGTGDDRMGGGSGTDTFVFEAGHGNDTIKSFDWSGDLIDLTAFTGITGIDDLNATQQGASVVIDLTAHDGGTITLENFALERLDAGDFVFYDPTVDGTAGADTLAGGAGADTLTGRAGDDTLTGGAGADTFVFAAGHGNDTVTDFTDGEDLIDLSAFAGISGFGDLTVTQVGGNVVIDLTGQTDGGTITLQGFDLDDLDGTDFVFYEAPPEGG